MARACVVLVRTQGAINLGMVARLCGNLGADELRLVAPRCRPDADESLAFATHARELLLGARIFPDISSATADCGMVVGTSGEFRTGELGPPLLPGKVPALLAARGVRRWALVFGNEADGLDTDELRSCQAWIHLDTFGPVTSYNLAHAVAIAGYAIATADQPESVPEARVADRGDVERLSEHWLSALIAAEHPPALDAGFPPRLRALIDRLSLDDKDVRALRGMLTNIQRALGKDGGVSPPPTSTSTSPD